MKKCKLTVFEQELKNNSKNFKERAYFLSFLFLHMHSEKGYIPFEVLWKYFTKKWFNTKEQNDMSFYYLFIYYFKEENSFIEPKTHKERHDTMTSLKLS